MTKQEEIKEGIRRIAGEWFVPDGLASQTMPNDRTFEGDIFSYLHSQKCRIEVDRELPILKWKDVEGTVVEVDADTLAKFLTMFDRQLKLMFNAGYVAVEPLIEEEK